MITAPASWMGNLKLKGSSVVWSVSKPCLTMICHARTWSHCREIAISKSWVSRLSPETTPDASSLSKTSVNHPFEKVEDFEFPFQELRNVVSTARNKLTRLTNPYRSRGSSDSNIAGSLIVTFCILTWFFRWRAYALSKISSGR